ncbi:DoxX family protein [Rhodococcoides fascians]|uniref:DoxX family protein n=1 Tax=Rhodococcoides fascians TaxID=1828 RepID=UPI000562A3A6|nr:DoxX family protein [Rhodococcus fascians]
MNIALWIIAAIVALAMLAAGISKLSKPRDALIASGKFNWANDFSSNQVRSIGVLEILGAIGLIVPAVTGIAVVLTPLAALGIAAVMVGAVIVHIRRHETNLVAPSAILALLALVVAVLRFGPYSF